MSWKKKPGQRSCKFFWYISKYFDILLPVFHTFRNSLFTCHPRYYKIFWYITKNFDIKFIASSHVLKFRYHVPSTLLQNIFIYIKIFWYILSRDFNIVAKLFEIWQNFLTFEKWKIVFWKLKITFRLFQKRVSKSFEKLQKVLTYFQDNALLQKVCKSCKIFCNFFEMSKSFATKRCFVKTFCNKALSWKYVKIFCNFSKIFDILFWKSRKVIFNFQKTIFHFSKCQNFFTNVKIFYTNVEITW